MSNSLRLYGLLECSLLGFSVYEIFQARNTGVSCHFLLQRIFLNLGLNPCLLDLLHWHSDSLPPCSFFLVLHRSFNYYIFLNFLTVKGLNFLFFPIFFSSCKCSEYGDPITTQYLLVLVSSRKTLLDSPLGIGE